MILVLFLLYTEKFNIWTYALYLEISYLQYHQQWWAQLLFFLDFMTIFHAVFLICRYGVHPENST